MADTIQSVTSALEVLDCFAVHEELGVSDVARRLGVAKSTAHRLLSTLAVKGIVEQSDETGKYYLGMHLAICHGPVDAITEVQVGERQAWSGNLTTSGRITALPGASGTRCVEAVRYVA